MIWFAVNLLAAALHVGGAIQSCTTVQDSCFRHPSCAVSLQMYLFECASFITGIQECAVPCKQALVRLLSEERATGLIDCHCDGERALLCEMARNKTVKCVGRDLINSIQKLKDPNVPVNCEVAYTFCLADPGCSEALELHDSNCKAMMEGQTCTPNCNNSIAVLFSQEKATRLKNCTCGENENIGGYSCKSVLSNMDRLCFNHNSVEPPPPPTAVIAQEKDKVSAAAVPSTSPPPPTTTTTTPYSFFGEGDISSSPSLALNWHLSFFLLLLFVH